MVMLDLKKEAIYRVTLIGGVDSFNGQYELTTSAGRLCFMSFRTNVFEYINPKDIFDIKELKRCTDE